MKNILFIFAFTLIALPVFAQTSNTTTTNTTISGTTNATVTSPGNVVVSTPNGTVGNQVNAPANSNNVYVITPNNSVNGANENDRNRRYGHDDRDNDRSDYNRAQSQHDYRDRSNYYNIRRNEQIEAQGGTNELSRRNYQSDYHSSYPSYFGTDHRSHRHD